MYFDSHDNQDRLFGFLSAVLRVTDTQLPFTDPVRLIMDGLFPEAMTYGLQQVYSLSMREAEEIFHSGPPIDQSEVEDFCRRIGKRLKMEGKR